MKKIIPTFETDEEVERFVDTADLSQYELSGGRAVRCQPKPKDKSVDLRLPEQLLEAAQPREPRRDSLSALHPHGPRTRLAAVKITILGHYRAVCALLSIPVMRQCATAMPNNMSATA